jgi:YVTN family beta-propeller protein
MCSNLNSADVSVIDPASNTVVGRIAVGVSPSWVAMSPF